MVRRKQSVLIRALTGRAARFLYLLGAIAVVIVVLELTNVIHIFHHQRVPAVIPTSSNTESSKSSSTNNSKTTGPEATNPTNNIPASSSGLTLVAPYGNFVSNHHPSSSTSLDEVSVCSSTPGATCYIKFTMGQTTTQLTTQTIGSNDSTTWDWNVTSDAHLTSGQWQITAVANLNGQSKSTEDQQMLVVQ